MQNHQLRDKLNERHEVQENNQPLSLQITATEGIKAIALILGVSYF